MVKGKGRGLTAPPFALVRGKGVGKVVKYHGWNRFRLQFSDGEERSYHRNELVFTNNPNKQPTKKREP